MVTKGTGDEQRRKPEGEASDVTVETKHGDHDS
jgi:hypothetical protein